jgi:hypothetical protein
MPPLLMQLELEALPAPLGQGLLGLRISQTPPSGDDLLLDLLGAIRKRRDAVLQRAAPRPDRLVKIEAQAVELPRRKPEAPLRFLLHRRNRPSLDVDLAERPTRRLTKDVAKRRKQRIRALVPDLGAKRALAQSRIASSARPARLRAERRP